ncbi:helix-turn-helix domain-containing protein [Rickettsiella endosymbiont of Rhagonycha lignosa]|uniref:helix-turn-helix domain-containing protein n=1 Tax=Rickettsiella endosymbiont of Rhagonycha lignosa TaxID=3077937 RepID=UPI00313E0E0E
MKKNPNSIKEKNTSLSIDIQERANRLRYLRKMSHLSMKEFAQHCNLGLTTINYWEQGYSSVTERGAQKVSKAMREEGIECSVIWLMTGYGEPPKVTDSSKLSKLNYKSLESLSRISINEKKSDYPLENNEIKEELALFRKNYPEHLIYLIDNESMKPLYGPGDLVAGKKLTDKNMELGHGADCIVELEGRELLIRRVKIAHVANSYDLYVINSDASLEFPPLRNMKVLSLAPIIRIWKPVKF